MSKSEIVENKFDYVMKIVICGNQGVGKTKLLTRYIKNEFVTESNATIGVDFFAKDYMIEDEMIKIQFFDTAGQEKYRALCTSYYKNADGIILVYDVTKRESFDQIEQWLTEIKTHIELPNYILLIGNKIDLESERRITIEEGKKFAEDQKIFFAETSALTNKDQCVMKGFEIIINEIIQELKKQKKDEDTKEFERIHRNSIKFGFEESLLIKDDKKCKC